MPVTIVIPVNKICKPFSCTLNWIELLRIARFVFESFEKWFNKRIVVAYSQPWIARHDSKLIEKSDKSHAFHRVSVVWVHELRWAAVFYARVLEQLSWMLIAFIFINSPVDYASVIKVDDFIDFFTFFFRYFTSSSVIPWYFESSFFLASSGPPFRQARHFSAEVLFQFPSASSPVP